MTHAKKRMNSARYVALATILIALVLILAPAAHADWVEFVDATAIALNAAPDLVADDLQEKDYAWGDVDMDGDVDLVIVRKEPFTTLGKFPNVLLINENGVLTDRTADFASETDVEGDNGFLTATNDRDVVVVDLDLDGWLDIVTATTLSDFATKAVGHPRVYMNQGCTGACDGTQDWLGFIYEEARIPQIMTYEGADGANPRFCAVSAGDVTGDGYPDLYFSDYDIGVHEPLPGPDFNDKLLINLGELNPGVFVDVTDERFVGIVPNILVAFEWSNFGAANTIVDINGDDIADIVKHTALGTPYYIGIALTDPGTPGFFEDYHVLWQGAPYFISSGDLNNDDLPDLILTEDGDDRYFINDGEIPFTSYLFGYSHTGTGGPSSDEGFGSNSLAVDLDNDGWNEVMIADVDVDVQGCNRRMHLFRNLGGTPGAVPVLEEQTTGSNCEFYWGSPPTCLVAGIPSDKLVGTHDMAAFDINGDGWKDLVIGRCTGTEIYFNMPPVSPAGEIDSPMLLLDKVPSSSEISLSWGDSCLLSDDDFSVYEGDLDVSFTSHEEVVCGTDGATSHVFEPAGANCYYLVVPHNGINEGSYGNESGGPRGQGSSACYPMNTQPCE